MSQKLQITKSIGTKIKKIKITELTPDPNNANLGTERGRAMLEKSIQELGFGRSLVVDKHGRIIAGNKSHEVAGASGFDEVIVIETDGTKAIAIQRTDLDLATDDKAKLLAIADNRSSEVSLKWDTEVLLDLDQEIDLSGFFTDDELNELSLSLDEEKIHSIGQGKGNSSEWEKPPRRCELGQIWQLGRHKLICGDATDALVVEKLFSDSVPDLIWSDPPYGIKCQHKDGSIGGGSKNYKSKKYPVIANDQTPDVAIASWQICQKFFPKAVQIWWGANHYSQTLSNSSCWIVWDKLNGDSNFADCELAWTNSTTSVRKFPWMWNGMLKQGEAASAKRIHPNQKPVEMVEWFWDNYCNDSNLCFDPFLGSGTTIISAQKHPKRTVFGLELMSEYCDLILQRWGEVSKEEPLLIGALADYPTENNETEVSSLGF